MNADYYMGDDNRDELTQEEEYPSCHFCGAGPDDACLTGCGCMACRVRDKAIPDPRLPEVRK